MKAALVIGIVLIFSSTLCADTSVTITRKSRNMYKVKETENIIQTRNCYEYAFNDTVQIMDSGRTLYFPLVDTKCTITDVYKPFSLDTGEQRAELNMEDFEWFNIIGSNIYLETSGCPEMTFSSSALITVHTDGSAHINMINKRCGIKKAYKRSPL